MIEKESDLARAKRAMLKNSLSIREELKHIDELPEGPGKDRLRRVKKNYEDGEPLFAQLRQMYPGLETPNHLTLAGIDFSAAGPLLLHWLPKIANLDVKASISGAMRYLHYPSGEGAVAIAAEIKKVILGWPRDVHRDTAVDSMVLDLVEMTPKDQANLLIGLVTNPGLSSLAQEFLVRAISKAGNKKGADAIAGLLRSDDEQLVVATIRALAHLRAKHQVSKITALQNHRSAKVRAVAEKAVRQLTRSAK